MAFTTALSGVNAAQSDLDVISNNIANSSTTGFKTARAEFGDVYAQSLLGTTTPTPGQGVKVTGITQQFSQGDLEFTDNALDVAINGDGFFQVKDAGVSNTLARVPLRSTKMVSYRQYLALGFRAIRSTRQPAK